MIGKTVGPYRILALLGEGGMGVVYEAEDTRLGRHVALKFLPPSMARAEESKARFRREAEAASLLDHPNICTIHDIVETDEGQLCIAMPCYQGESVRTMLDRGPLDLDDAIDLGIQILRGLGKAHEAGIIHRDIKPANLFVTNDGILKILDFGLARISDSSSMTGTGSLLGTIAYASPEQIRHEKAGPAADLWAAGVTIYEMLTGSLPFPAEYEAALIYSILQEEPIPIRELRPEVPDHVAKLLYATLQKDSARRPGEIREMIDCLSGELDAVRSIPGTSGSPVSEAKYQLTVMGRTIDLDEGEWVVGRSSDLPIPIVASSVSRRHAKILVKNDGVTIEDLSSKNGTWVGDTKVESPTSLSDFEEISFGRVHAIFRSRKATTSLTITDLG